MDAAKLAKASATALAKASATPRVAKRATLVLAAWLGFWILSLGLVAGLLWIPFTQVSYRGAIELSGWVALAAGLTLACRCARAARTVTAPRRSSRSRARQRSLCTRWSSGSAPIWASPRR